MAALTFVQANTGIAVASSLAVAYSSNTTAGSYLLAVVGIRVGAGTLTNVTSPGNAWTQVGGKITTPGLAGTAQDVYLYQCAKNVTNGAQTVTFTASGSSVLLGGIAEFTGQAIISPLDAQVSNVGTSSVTGTNMIASPVLASSANEEIIVIGNQNIGGTISSGSGFTVPSTMNGGVSGSFLEYIAKGTSGSYGDTFSSSSGALTDYGVFTLAVRSTSTPSGGGNGMNGSGLLRLLGVD